MYLTTHATVGIEEDVKLRNLVVCLFMALNK